MPITNIEIPDGLTRVIMYKLERLSKEISEGKAVVELSGDGIGDVGTEMLCRPLFGHITLRELRLPDNKITDKGAAFVATAIAPNNKLNVLRLDGNKIGHEAKVAKGLEKHKNIQFVWFMHNRIGDLGVTALANCLTEKHNKLSWLGLCHNEISDEGVIALASGLAEHAELEWLGLEGNKITDNGVRQLAIALKKHEGLEYLWLNHNFVGAPGAEAVARALKDHEFLIWLGLEHNPLGYEGVAKLTEILGCSHKGLEWLQLRERVLDPDWRAEIRKDIDFNDILAEEKGLRAEDEDFMLKHFPAGA